MKQPKAPVAYAFVLKSGMIIVVQLFPVVFSESTAHHIVKHPPIALFRVEEKAIEVPKGQDGQEQDRALPAAQQNRVLANRQHDGDNANCPALALEGVGRHPADNGLDLVEFFLSKILSLPCRKGWGLCLYVFCHVKK